MFLAHAKPQPLDFAQIAAVGLQCLDDGGNPALIIQIETVKLIYVITARTPFELRKIDIIRYAKVMEGAEEAVFNSFAKSYFAGNAIVEIFGYVFPIQTFRSCSQAQQKIGVEVPKEPVVGCS